MFVMAVLSFPPFCRGDNCGLERIRDLPKVTQLVNAEARFQTQYCPTAKPVLGISVSVPLWDAFDAMTNSFPPWSGELEG